MCETFPYFPEYLGFIPLRLGLLFISIQSMMTGAFCLALMELLTKINFLTFKAFFQSVGTKAFSHLGLFVNSGYTLISFDFILVGLLLFLSTLWDSEDLIHTCVWGIFVNALFASAVTFALFISCLTEDLCLLSSIDWFSGSIMFVALIFMITYWMYNACIVHSYLQFQKICQVQKKMCK